ncbi:hypothetical protein HBH1_02096 [Herbaspirillum sp. BH-1]|uniref:DUF3892 domain-containing protein n=1 Tax=Herbaspirillum sp. (strain BH-1) TaxID=2058884 RepID=UPI000C888DFA|nr:DUF3892 domain-containing protein [Herbaspirillum sp. BH-1]PLY59586.1 hypothetical protein HBH1_02096 [Herbaspirillum sp. BH-1]
MADFCITAVRYNEKRTHIDFVLVNEEKPDALGPDRIVARAFVADLIRLKKATFITRFKGPEKGYKHGADVHVIDDEYLTTEPNKTAKDNLGNLPEF